MLQELIDKYIQDNEVTFILQAVNGDGEVLVKAESSQSFDDVSSESWQLDQAFNKIVMESEEGRDDDLHDAVVMNELDERSY